MLSLQGAPESPFQASPPQLGGEEIIESLGTDSCHFGNTDLCSTLFKKNRPINPSLWSCENLCTHLTYGKTEWGSDLSMAQERIMSDFLEPSGPLPGLKHLRSFPTPHPAGARVSAAEAFTVWNILMIILHISSNASCQLGDLRGLIH